MRALLFDGTLRVVADYPRPELQPGAALVRITLAGVCRTDLEIVRGYAGFRGVLGHELVGVVAACDDPAWLGRRVTAEINIPCHACPTCRRGDGIHCPHRTALGIRGRDGAFADYCLIPIANLHAVPDTVSDEQAVFTEPLAAALAILQRHPIAPSHRVVLVGDGKLGLLVSQVVRLTGCDLLLVGHHAEKLALARSWGVAGVLERDVPEGREWDYVVECSGSSTGLALAVRLVRPRGTIVLKSTFHGETSLDLSSLVVDEVTLAGSRCGPFAPALRLLAQGLVEPAPLISGVFPLSEAVAALRPVLLKHLIKPS